MSEAIEFVTSPKRRGYWIVAAVILALSYGGHRLILAAELAEIERLEQDADSLRAVLAAENALRTRAEAEKAAADSTLEAVRKDGQIARASASAERVEASEAILGLQAGIDSLRAAGDSVVSIEVVDSLTVEHDRRARADSVTIVTLEADTTALSNSLTAAEVLIESMRAEALVTAELLANAENRFEVSQSALDRALDPPFTVKLFEGGPWLGIGIGIGWLLSR